jgi:hypothetical protein
MAIECVGTHCKRSAVFLFLAFLAVTATSATSSAQVAPRWEIFGGYSYRNFDSPTIGYASRSNLNGFNIEPTFNLNTQWSIVADVSGQYGSQLTVYNFLFGPQYSWRKEKSKFFVNGLFGKGQNTVNIKTETRNGFESVGLAVAAGGGYDRDLTPRFTLRVVEADYVHTHTFDASQNDVRVSTGLIFHFGQIGHRPKL